MTVLAHGRTPQLQQLGFALLMQENFKRSYLEIDGRGPASSYAEGV